MGRSRRDKPSECSLTLEVIGSYATTPDLQYARIEKPLGQPDGSLDVIFCIDVTSSMSDDIDSVKAAAASIVGSIAAKDPGFRVARDRLSRLGRFRGPGDVP